MDEEFKFELIGFEDAVGYGNLIEDFKYENTEEGILIKVKEEAYAYVSSVCASIEGKNRDEIKAFTLRFLKQCLY